MPKNKFAKRSTLSIWSAAMCSFVAKGVTTSVFVAGMSLQPPQRAYGEPEGASSRSDPSTEKRALYRVAAWAENEFHRCLLESPEAELGRIYRAERGLNSETINRFKLGFAPNRWDWILERARGTEWAPPLLERVGLLRRKELGGGHYDWFRGRVM